MKVLLVEDQEMNVDMLKRRLERRGCSIDVAGDGASALAKASAGVYDIILMDIGLPDISGLEVTARLRSQKETSSIPIIALTAHALVGDREKALASGCDEQATKPIDFNRLLRMMEDLTARAGLA